MTDDDLFIRVTDLDGVEHRLPALEGWRVMEIIRDHGLPIKAECGGACACATCHIYIHPDWQERIDNPRDDEVEQLDDAFAVGEGSRLSCQILFSHYMNGIRLQLAPGDL